MMHPEAQKVKILISPKAHKVNIKIAKQLAETLRKDFCLPVTEVQSEKLLYLDDNFVDFPSDYLVTEIYYQDEVSSFGLEIDEEH